MKEGENVKKTERERERERESEERERKKRRARAREINHTRAVQNYSVLMFANIIN